MLVSKFNQGSCNDLSTTTIEFIHTRVFIHMKERNYFLSNYSRLEIMRNIKITVRFYSGSLKSVYLETPENRLNGACDEAEGLWFIAEWMIIGFCATKQHSMDLFK